MAGYPEPETAARAVLAALDFRSSLESRQAALTYLESIKSGDVMLLGTIATALIRQSRWSSEVRHYGLKMLQHLVRMRWKELSPEHRMQLAELVVDLISGIATPHQEWVLKSQTAALMAEVARQEGASLWQEILSKLFDISTASPCHAELVVMVLRWFPEDVTVYNEDLEGDRRKQLLMGITQTLPYILPFFFKILGLHFGEAVRLLEQDQADDARQHAFVVTATLNALLAYSEWAPVTDLASNGLIEACGYLLNAVDFRLAACVFLKQIASRRRRADESPSLYVSAITRVFEVMTGAVQGSLFSMENENDVEYIECLCDTMAALGSQSLQYLTENHLTVYLEQMMRFLKHDKVSVHYRALRVWLTLLREVPAPISFPGKAVSVNHDSTWSGGTLPALTHSGKLINFIVSEVVYGNLLDVGFLWFLRKNYGKGLQKDVSVEYIDDLSSSGDYNNHRGCLLELVRLIAVRCPNLAISKISEKINEVWENTAALQPNLTLLEGAQRLLECIIHVLFDDGTAFAITHSLELVTKVEGILKVLLLAKWNEPAVLEIHGHYLDAMGPYLRISSVAALHAVEKLFDIFVSLPIISRGLGQDILARTSSRARLQVCTSFLRIAKVANRALSPYMESIAKTVVQLQEQGQILQGELNLLGEAFLVISSAGGSQQQSQVLDWFLRPQRYKWGQIEWQEKYLSSPISFVDMLCRKSSDNRPDEEMWSIFHTLTFFERVLKWCGIENSKCNESSDAGLIPSEAFTTSMLTYLMWMIPSLLKLLRCVHSLWSPSITCLLPCEVQMALKISEAEQAALVGEAGSKKSRGVPFTAPANDPNTAGLDSHVGRESEIRNWLKGVRDSGYSVIGLAATYVSDSLFVHTDHFLIKTALLESLEAMELRHIRQLLHSVIIPLVKVCPSSSWELWLGNLLPELLVHCEKVLSLSWANLISEGAVKGHIPLTNTGLALKAEMMEEKMLRDLTRETCTLLAVLGSPALNMSLSSAEQLYTQSSQLESGVTNSSFELGSDCLMSFMMKHQNIAMVALSICNQALKWPDTEAVHKTITFCGAIVTLATASNIVELQKFASKDLFTSVIEALAIESNASAHAELLNLFRIIYLQLANKHEYPRQILRLLPSITSHDLVSFDNTLSKTSSAKEQKQHIKSLLLMGGGSQLRALVSQKTATVITNVSNRAITPYQSSPTNDEENGTIGLASII